MTELETKIKNIPQVQFEIRQLVGEINRKFTSHFMKIIDEKAIPKIKWPITPGKLKHRRIKLIQKSISSSETHYWLEQRGEQIGEIFVMKIEANFK